jgi:hypothetical protein
VLSRPVIRGGSAFVIGAKSGPSAIQNAIDRDIRPLLDLVDRLRKYGIVHDFAIPKMPVLDDQVRFILGNFASTLYNQYVLSG